MPTYATLFSTQWQHTDIYISSYESNSYSECVESGIAPFKATYPFATLLWYNKLEFHCIAGCLEKISFYAIFNTVSDPSFEFTIASMGVTVKRYES